MRLPSSANLLPVKDIPTVSTAPTGGVMTKAGDPYRRFPKRGGAELCLNKQSDFVISTAPLRSACPIKDGRLAKIGPTCYSIPKT